MQAEAETDARADGSRAERERPTPADGRPEVTQGHQEAQHGHAGAGAAADAVASVLYTPYHLAIFGLACVLVWGAPNTWSFTERLTPVRAAYGFLLLGTAVLLMWTQTVNPFLYFQF